MNYNLSVFNGTKLIFGNASTVHPEEFPILAKEIHKYINGGNHVVVQLTPFKQVVFSASEGIAQAKTLDWSDGEMLTKHSNAEIKVDGLAYDKYSGTLLVKSALTE